MESNIVQIGNSMGIILPASILKRLNLAAKDQVLISLKNDSIIIHMIKKLSMCFLGVIAILFFIMVFGGIRKDIKVIRPIFSIVHPDSSNTPTIVLGMNHDYYYFLNASQTLDSMKRGFSEEYLMKANTSYIERIEYSSENDRIRSIIPFYWSKVTVSVTSIGITLKKNINLNNKNL